jgi:hypothetical protein
MIGLIMVCIVIAIIFGFFGLFNGEGFFNYGFILMMFCSIPSLILLIIEIFKVKKI